MSTRPIPPDERDQLAAELALGVLEGDELAAARELLASDPEFRAQVGEWLGRYAPMLDEVQPVEPPERLWAAIQGRLGGPAAANDNVSTLRRRLNLWRGIGAGASALAASLALVLVTRAPQPDAPVAAPAAAPAPMIAMLGDEQKPAMLVASWSPADRSLRVAAAAEIQGDPAHSHELWVIPADGTPRSLGTMPADVKMQKQVDPALSRELQQGATLAVSVEPRGGSPTGQPTGPVIASGKLERA